MSISKICVATACAAATATATAPKWHELTTAYTFEQYVEDFQKSYDTAEYAQRKAIFEQKLIDILAHNAHEEVTYKLGVNQFTDMRTEDMPRNLEMSNPASRQSANPTRMHERSGKPLPKEVDWRKSPGVVAAVRNQGECGNCWAHSAVESLESQWALKKGPLNQLSSQSLSDCRGQTPKTTTNVSCGGGWYFWGWESFMQRKGQSVPTEWYYSYHSIGGQKQDCQLPDHGLKNTSYGPVKVTGYVQVKANVEDIMDAVATVGPLSMGLDASWPGYAEGVYTGNPNKSQPTWPCPPSIDHAVILDGYGTDEKTGLDYWLVRNSWSAGWGENGYIRILRDSSATCNTDGQHGISLSDFYYPLVE